MISNASLVTRYASHFQKKRIRLLGIERLVCPHDSHHVRIAQILNVVRVTYRDIHHLQLVARNIILIDFLSSIFRKRMTPCPLTTRNFSFLCVMPVVSFGNARLGNIHRHLSSIGRFQEFSKGTPFIHIHFERIGELIFGQIAQVG